MIDEEANESYAINYYQMVLNMIIKIKSDIGKIELNSKVTHLAVALTLVLSFGMMITVPTLAAPVVTSITETAFGTVIGVVSDFHLHSLHKEIPPMIIAFNSQSIRSLLVKLNPENFTEFIESLGSKWGEYSDSEPFECKLLSDSFDELYSEDKRFGKFIGVFTSLAIFIALLGLFGMSLFSCEQRSKEIGIRKVMGASSRSILVKLSGEFLVLVIIALFFAFPTAYYFMNKWLQNFEFASNIKIWIFILTTIISCLVVLLTVSFQSRKAANSNPVNTLRYE